MKFWPGLVLHVIHAAGRVFMCIKMFAVLPSMELEVETSQGHTIDYSRKL